MSTINSTAQSRKGRAGAHGRIGHGLVGMRERVSLYGGTLSAKPGPAGGFEVRAELPLQGGAG